MGAVAFSDLITFTRASGGGRFNAQGQYEWLPANTPRIDYDPVTGECRGLLVEGQRTNLLPHSSDFANAVWGKNGGFTTPNATLSPDGITSAFKYTPPSGSSTSSLQLTRWRSGTTGQHYGCVYVKAAEVSEISLIVGGAGAATRYLAFDLDARTTRGISPGSGVIAEDHIFEDVGNGWFRIGIRLSADTTTGDIQIRGVGTFDGVKGFYLWGAQLEAGSFPSSYIPTTDAQVTRAADVASVNTLSPWYNPEQGTLFVEAVSLGIGIGGAACAVMLSDGTSGNLMAFHQYAGSVLRTITCVKGGVTNVLMGRTYSPDGTVRRSIGAYQVDNFYGAVSGVGSSDTSGDVPVVTKMAIGSTGIGSSSQFINGHIRAIRYFPRRLSDTELQALTA